MSGEQSVLNGRELPLHEVETFAPSPREIAEARTPAGGWTKKQLAAWSVPWPPPKDWCQDLIALGDRQRIAFATAHGWREGADGSWRRAGTFGNPMTLEGACALEAIFQQIDSEPEA